MMHAIDTAFDAARQAAQEQTNRIVNELHSAAEQLAIAKLVYGGEMAAIADTINSAHKEQQKHNREFNTKIVAAYAKQDKAIEHFDKSTSHIETVILSLTSQMIAGRVVMGEPEIPSPDAPMAIESIIKGKVRPAMTGRGMVVTNG